MDSKYSNSVKAEEVYELLNYVGNNGIEVPADILKPLFTYITISSNDGDRENILVDTLSEESLAIHQAYARLTKITSPVSGKTIIHSRGYRDSVSSIKLSAILFLVIALSNEMIGMYFGDTTVPDECLWAFVYLIHIYLLTPLSPIIWGALGSCIFLLKRFSDIAADRTFDTDFIGGWQTRVLLGAILGGVIQYIYDPGFIVESGMDENALAFLVGVSVKVFYGALEKLIDAVADKLNLSAIRRNKSEKKDFSELLVKKIAEGNLTEEQRKILLELLEKDK